MPFDPSPQGPVSMWVPEPNVIISGINLTGLFVEYQVCAICFIPMLVLPEKYDLFYSHVGY
jgi:hypothetical protein